VEEEVLLGALPEEGVLPNRVSSAAVPADWEEFWEKGVIAVLSERPSVLLEGMALSVPSPELGIGGSAREVGRAAPNELNRGYWKGGIK
jgi:hypothetical protein